MGDKELTEAQKKWNEAQKAGYTRTYVDSILKMRVEEVAKDLDELKEKVATGTNVLQTSLEAINAMINLMADHLMEMNTLLRETVSHETANPESISTGTTCPHGYAYTDGTVAGWCPKCKEERQNHEREAERKRKEFLKRHEPVIPMEAKPGPRTEPTPPKPPFHWPKSDADESSTSGTLRAEMDRHVASLDRPFPFVDSKTNQTFYPLGIECANCKHPKELHDHGPCTYRHSEMWPTGFATSQCGCERFVFPPVGTPNQRLMAIRNLYVMVTGHSALGNALQTEWQKMYDMNGQTWGDLDRAIRAFGESEHA